MPQNTVKLNVNRESILNKTFKVQCSDNECSTRAGHW